MPYQSVDQLQRVLADTVFTYTKDAKKASGRALGTLVEIITFYLLKAWGFENSIEIERPLPEYGNPDITHNVEYSIHPILKRQTISLPYKLPVTSTHILSHADMSQFLFSGYTKNILSLFSSGEIVRNSCVIAFNKQSRLIANIIDNNRKSISIEILEQYYLPYAMIECKRVGIEEGMKKGPQTIEKAKQGAYVAKAVSSLHKIREETGELHGIIYKSNHEIYTKSYSDLLAEIIASNNIELLKNFVLTIGIVSNHGNWFTSENHNKELKVLAQSYDWLLFLTDLGLTKFITELLLAPKPELEPARIAFLASYNAEKT